MRRRRQGWLRIESCPVPLALDCQDRIMRRGRALGAVVSASRLHKAWAWRTQFPSLGPKWTKARKIKPSVHSLMDRLGLNRLQLFSPVRRRLGGNARPSRIRPLQPNRSIALLPWRIVKWKSSRAPDSHHAKPFVFRDSCRALRL